MAALSDDYQRQRRAPGSNKYTVKNDEVLYAGALCNVDTNGEALAATDTAGEFFGGVYYGPNRIDNSDDGEEVILDRHSVFLATGSGFSAGDVGKPVYIVDDNTVGLDTASTNRVYVGRIVQYVSATQVWVDPNLDDDFLLDVSEAVADATSATSTNGTAGAVTLTAVDALTSTDGTAAAASADLAALAAEAEKIGDDVRALHTVVDTQATELAALIAEIEKIGDDARAALTSAGATITALKTIGLLVDPS